MRFARFFLIEQKRTATSYPCELIIRTTNNRRIVFTAHEKSIRFRQSIKIHNHSKRDHIPDWFARRQSYRYI